MYLAFVEFADGSHFIIHQGSAATCLVGIEAAVEGKGMDTLELDGTEMFHIIPTERVSVVEQKDGTYKIEVKGR